MFPRKISRCDHHSSNALLRLKVGEKPPSSALSNTTTWIVRCVGLDSHSRLQLGEGWHNEQYTGQSRDNIFSCCSPSFLVPVHSSLRTSEPSSQPSVEYGPYALLLFTVPTANKCEFAVIATKHLENSTTNPEVARESQLICGHFCNMSLLSNAIHAENLTKWFNSQAPRTIQHLYLLRKLQRPGNNQASRGVWKKSVSLLQ